MYYAVGIDPQPSVLACYIGKFEKRNVSNSQLPSLFMPMQDVFWFQVSLQRKDSFKTADEWEIYVSDQCRKTIDKIERCILADSVNSSPGDVHLNVEQQRGRINTIPEACLVTAGLAKGWHLYVPHPTTWKKGINFYGEDKEEKKQIKGNKMNKERVMELEGEHLANYCSKKNLTVPKVSHHLCDAACIARYGRRRVINDASDRP